MHWNHGCLKCVCSIGILTNGWPTQHKQTIVTIPQNQPIDISHYYSRKSQLNETKISSSSYNSPTLSKWLPHQNISKLHLAMAPLSLLPYTRLYCSGCGIKHQKKDWIARIWLTWQGAMICAPMWTCHASCFTDECCTDSHPTGTTHAFHTWNYGTWARSTVWSGVESTVIYATHRSINTCINCWSWSKASSNSYSQLWDPCLFETFSINISAWYAQLSHCPS